MIAVAQPGKRNHVIDGSACGKFVLDVRRTDTNVNDIRLMDGSLDVECPELQGQVTFEGCQ